MLKSEDIFAQGYAIPTYDIDNGIQHWRFRSEEYTLPYASVPTWHLEGLSFEVAKIEQVRDYAKTLKGEYLG